MVEKNNGSSANLFYNHSSSTNKSTFQSNILKEIKNRVKPQQYNTWFRKLPLIQYNDSENVLSFEVPNKFYLEWLKIHYFQIVVDSAKAVLGLEPNVTFSICKKTHSKSDKTKKNLPRQSFHSKSNIYFKDEILLNSDYTFDTFVLGPCNRLPHAAALSIVDSPAMAYNPLFIYGSAGLGKTHLLQATCHALLKKREDIKILYLSCETFVNHFISSIEKGDLENFRYKYRFVDVLLVDDIHFLANKERTQEEFFHTFNTLYNSRKQIILSSDSPPKEIPTLEDRLVSRFKWGLVTQIDPPSYETRVAILHKKAKLRKIDLPDDVAHFIGANIDTNIRELEGALIKVVSLSSLENRKIDLALCREALKDIVPKIKKRLSLNDITTAVSNTFGVKVSDLQSKKRAKSVAFPRQICMYLAREKTDFSLEEIGSFLGGRDHTTVIYAIEKIKKTLTKDPDLIDTVEKINSLLKP